ncbi:aspartate/glutamate racemase family protein [Denitrobaculum tricleocarpae]|uniref:aspartate/glutamate racemase family protein n=1 Tax=Denitrobaculum tricleocarpae TaxID=2591009 RepID=UPI001C550625|nr:aspartate/glutamate racemase family protein [Denitrobaculum tricleocarpae]
MTSIKIWYQSYVDYDNGKSYWDVLGRHLDEIVAPGTTVDINGITPFDSYAHPLVEFRCAREMICNAVQAEREGYDAFVVGHFQDAGLYEVRAAVDIPVIALGEASMLYCCQLGQRIGIVTINPRFIPWFHHQIGKYGLKERISGVHAMTFEPGQILEAYSSNERADQVKALFEEQARPLVAQGTDVLIPGGGIPMLLFAKYHNHLVDEAPVINGIPIAVKMAEMAVTLKRLTGQSVSRVSDYAKAPPEVIEEFLAHPKGL